MDWKRAFWAAVLIGGMATAGCGDDDGGGDVDSGVAMGDDAGPVGGEDAGGGEEDAGGPDYLCDYPAAPYGTSVGRKFEPFTLQQCNGTPYDFVNEEFCAPDHQLTLISIAAGWCNPCIIESMQLEEEINERYAGMGVRVIQIITQDPEFRAPTLEFCQQWVDRFGLTNVEVIDPEQITNIYFPDNALPSTIIVDEEGTIRYRENGASDGLISLRAKIDELLAED
jgi:hypothetical protein